MEEYVSRLKDENTDALFDDLGLLVKHKFLGVPEHEILGATVMGDTADIPAFFILSTPFCIACRCNSSLDTAALARFRHEGRRHRRMIVVAFDGLCVTSA